MDTVTILRELWRLRLFVAVVALISLLACITVAFKISPPSTLESRRYEVGVATARILVDTPNSQVVDVAPKGSDTLGVRANLLASLMVDGEIKSTIAKRAGLKPGQLVGQTDAATSPTPDTVPSERTAFILKTQVLTNTSGDQLPIIEVDAQAPTAAAAARLASAAVDGLRAYLNSRAALQRIADADRLQVSGLGLPQAGIEARGPSPILALIAGIFVFILGCGTILLVRGLKLGLRAAAERERLGVDAPAPAWEHAVEYEDHFAPQPEPAAPRRPTLVSAPSRPAKAPRRDPVPPQTPPPPSSGGRKSRGQSAWDAPAPLRAAADE